MLPQYAQAAQSAENPSDAYVLSILAECHPVIRRVARSYGLDVEDLTQDLVVKMLERPRSLKNPTAYYTATVQGMAITRASKDLGAPHLSLDVPAYASSDLTLADILPAGPVGMEEDHRTEDAHATIVYAALQRLPLDEQEYLCEVHRLTSYMPTDTGVRLRTQRRRETRSRRNTRHNIHLSAYRRLRKDQVLLHDIETVYASH
jgi:DNA-directed RNA polymerase specialized sigma24 family protein